MVSKCFLASAAVLIATAFETPFQVLTFDQALASARAKNKIVIVDFFRSDTANSKRLDETTWNSADVRAWIDEHAVAIKIDLAETRPLAELFNCGLFQTVLFVNTAGKEMDRIGGYLAPKDFVWEANAILVGKTQVMRAKEKLVGHKELELLRKSAKGILPK